mgnify:CR=1 FL=1
MKKETLKEKVLTRKLAIYNDKTLKELKIALNNLFPKDKCTERIINPHKFYYVSELNTNNKYWECSNASPLPTCNLSDLLKEIRPNASNYEVNYEVLDWRRKWGTGKLTKIKDFNINDGGYIESRPYTSGYLSGKDTAEYILETFKIHCVKRKSDGAIFKIGDPAKTKIHNWGIIESFTISEYTNQILVDTNVTKSAEWLNDLIPIPKKGITTYDGFEIYEGDTFYAVNKETLDYRGKYVLNFEHFSPDVSYIFTTFQSASDWILENSKLFSLQDIKDQFPLARSDKKFQDLREEAKTRIQDQTSS